MSRSDDDIAMGNDEYDSSFIGYALRELYPVSHMCDSCTCCTWEDCIPSKCGEDDYGRFHCPCTSE